MNVEGTGQARSAEDPQEPGAVRDQSQSAVPSPRAIPRPAQHTQSGAVDEGNGPRVEYQVRAWIGGQCVQVGGERGHRQDVDLAL
jgi:hypothetical protein